VTLPASSSTNSIFLLILPIRVFLFSLAGRTVPPKGPLPELTRKSPLPFRLCYGKGPGLPLESPWTRAGKAPSDTFLLGL
jgi:hypothetical protein